MSCWQKALDLVKLNNWWAQISFLRQFEEFACKPRESTSITCHDATHNRTIDRLGSRGSKLSFRRWQAGFSGLFGFVLVLTP